MTTRPVWQNPASISPSRPLAVQAGRLRLIPFDSAFADLVATWVRSEEEAFWLAPHTAAPLTGEKVRGWVGENRQPFMLCETAAPEPLAYGELNLLHIARREYWLGHLVVRPERRGQGLGVELTRGLIRMAFDHFAATRVALVVFEGNQPAIACYKACGMIFDGREKHRFPAYNRDCELVRMAITRF
jgi:RimJ/RimL family protein N-acetyltransferase